MLKRLANVIYWGCSALAIICALIAIVMVNNGRALEIGGVLGIGMIAWISGWAMRYILTGNKGITP